MSDRNTKSLEHYLVNVVPMKEDTPTFEQAAVSLGLASRENIRTADRNLGEYFIHRTDHLDTKDQLPYDQIYASLALLRHHNVCGSGQVGKTLLDLLGFNEEDIVRTVIEVFSELRDVEQRLQYDEPYEIRELVKTPISATNRTLMPIKGLLFSKVLGILPEAKNISDRNKVDNGLKDIFNGTRKIQGLDKLKDNQLASKIIEFLDWEYDEGFIQDAIAEGRDITKTVQDMAKKCGIPTNNPNQVIISNHYTKNPTELKNNQSVEPNTDVDQEPIPIDDDAIKQAKKDLEMEEIRLKEAELRKKRDELNKTTAKNKKTTKRKPAKPTAKKKTETKKKKNKKQEKK